MLGGRVVVQFITILSHKWGICFLFPNSDIDTLWKHVTTPGWLTLQEIFAPLFNLFTSFDSWVSNSFLPHSSTYICPIKLLGQREWATRFLKNHQLQPINILWAHSAPTPAPSASFILVESTRIRRSSYCFRQEQCKDGTYHVSQFIHIAQHQNFKSVHPSIWQFHF